MREELAASGLREQDPDAYRQRTFELSVAGYFADPDGHLFEVDYEEVWVLDDDHRLVVDRVNTA